MSVGYLMIGGDVSPLDIKYILDGTQQSVYLRRGSTDPSDSVAL